jgi:hypothetical protein
MQTKQTTGLPGAVTIVAQACAKISGFEQLYKDMGRSLSVNGKSPSTLTNYGRQLAYLALHFNCLPTALDKEQVLDYLHHIKSNGTPSATLFKFTVYSRAICLQNAWTQLFAVQLTGNKTFGKTSCCSQPAGGTVTA